MRAIYLNPDVGEALLKKFLSIRDRGSGNLRIDQASGNKDTDIPDIAIRARDGRCGSGEKEAYADKCCAGNRGKGE
ncbi:MAG: hypothetical protein ACLPX5_06015 [Dissulfurispiraceae bacterium]